MWTIISTTMEDKVCSRCGKGITVSENVLGSGYGEDEEGNVICYECCGVGDHEYMLEHGVIDLYLTKRADGWVIQNWPGTLVIPVTRLSEGAHYRAGIQRHVWFRYEGEDWHGIQAGNSVEICKCKRLLKKC